MRASSLWRPWSQSGAIELATAAHEKAILDLKARYDLSDRTTPFEIAKDTAAFANSLGGTVLVGAHERNDVLGRKTGRIEGFVPGIDEVALIKAATVAARELCQPPIIVEPEIIRLTVEEQALVTAKPLPQSVTLVALNVHPLLGSPCGVAACDATGNRIGDAYRFPIRVVEGTRWLSPEELAFHMNSHERRMYLLLAQVPRGQQIQVWDKGQGRSSSGGKRLGKLIDLDAGRLIAKLELGTEKIIAHVPLVFVNAVWNDEKDVINVDVNGAFNATRYGGGPPFVPFGSVA